MMKSGVWTKYIIQTGTAKLRIIISMQAYTHQMKTGNLLTTFN